MVGIQVGNDFSEHDLKRWEKSNDDFFLSPFPRSPFLYQFARRFTRRIRIQYMQSAAEGLLNISYAIERVPIVSKWL